MNDLRRSLKDLIDDARLPDPPSIEELRERTRRRGHQSHQPRRLLAGVLTAAAVTSGVVLAIAYGPRSSTNGSNSSVTQLTPRPHAIVLGPEIGQPTVLAASNGRLWVSGYTPDNGDGPLLEFDEKTGTLLSTIPLPNGVAYQIAMGEDSVWLRTQQGEASTHLVKIDVSTHRIVANIDIQRDGGLAVTSDALWTIQGVFGLLRIDPQTGGTIATIPLPGGAYPPLSVTAGALGVFLGSPYDGSVLRVDEQTNTVSVVTHIGTRVNQMVELGGSLWVSTGTAVVEMPVNTGHPGRSIELGAPILGLTTDGHSIWVTTDKPKSGAFRVDPTSGEITPTPLRAGVGGLSAAAFDPMTDTTWATASAPKPSLVLLTH